MAQNTEIKTSNIASPKGDLAIKGIGESFKPNSSSGTAGLTIPIATTPFHGKEPEINTQYNSGGGNGVFGLGFTFSDWELILTKAANRFDLNSISDVIVQIKHTLLEGGSQFRDQVTDQDDIKNSTSNLGLSSKQLFSSQWQSLINGQSSIIEFEMSQLPFPLSIGKEKRGCSRNAAKPGT